jgi:hypothetical protein
MSELTMQQMERTSQGMFALCQDRRSIQTHQHPPLGSAPAVTAVSFQDPSDYFLLEMLVC